MNQEKNFISAVVYVHNRESEIENFLNVLYQELKEHFIKYEIICVNDASTDGSVERIRKVAEGLKDTTVTILNMSYFQGLELSMNAGVDLAIGDFVYEFDTTTIDYKKKLIFEVYQKSLTGFDIVSASAKKRERGTSHLFYRLFNHFSFYEYKMQTETFRILSRRAINRASAMNKTIPYRKAVYANCGLESVCMKYEVEKPETEDGKSFTEKTYRRNLAMDSLILFTEFGYRFAMGMTMIMMLTAIIAAIYTVVVFVLGHPVAGWTTTMLFLAFAFFGIFAILTVVVKYLSVLVGLTFKRQQYRFSGIEKITK